MIKFDYTWAKKWLDKDLSTYQAEIDDVHNKILNKTGEGSDFLGWVDWLNKDISYILEEIDSIKETLLKKHKIKYLLVIGIGGSYLGAKAALEMLQGSLDKGVEVIFAGYHLDSEETYNLYNKLKDEKFAINVISKSGTTLEPAISFRIFKDLLMKNNPSNYQDLIIATTDAQKGALVKLADQEGFKRLVIPSDVGGRYSVFTPVGLLPLAVAGANINEFLNGARDLANQLTNKDINNNIAYKYALIRNLLYKQNKHIEILANYKQSLNYLASWWKQLFGESEGKNGKSLYVSSVSYTTDLHSLGQYIQDGPRHLFQTIVLVEEVKDFLIPNSEDNLDGLNYLSNKGIDYVNQNAFEGALKAHNEGGVPNLLIKLNKIDEYHIGSLFYFFMYACAASGYLLGVNPFNQPGVEAYKSNMYKLLGK